MESIGLFLKQAREERGLSIDQVARDTNISRHYIVALEEDRHEVFPAEPYVIGFLRNYSDHLGLNAEELINKYRSIKIQDQPPPLDELIRKPTVWPTKTIGLAVAAVVGVVLLIFVLPPLFGLLAKIPQALASAMPPQKPQAYVFEAAKKELVQRLYPGDSVMIDLNGQKYAFALKDITDEAILNAAPGDYKLRLGDELFLDLDGDSSQDLRLFLKDLSPNEPKRGAEFSFERLAASGALTSEPASLGNELKPGQAQPGTVSLPSVEQKPIIILQDVPAKPFTLDVVFRGFALFRYVVDDNYREENYFHKGDTVRIDASRKVKIWVSNAGAFAGKINTTTDFEIGRGGEVVARTIEWSKDDAGKIILVANPLN